MKNLGIVLIVLGILMMFFNQLNFVTKKKIVDLDTLEIKKKEAHPVQWTPIVGIIIFVGGITCIGLAKNKKEMA